MYSSLEFEGVLEETNKKVEEMHEKHIINFVDIILDFGPEERRTCQTAGENQTTGSDEGHGGS